MPNFEIGRIYTRTIIHDTFGGQRQSGISTPSNHPFIMLFTNDNGQAFGYRDGFTDNGIYFYTGQGQTGDMVFTRGNLAIRDHQANGKALNLFTSINLLRGKVSYIGEFEYIRYHYEDRPDVNHQMRRAIIFELRQVG